MRTRSRFSVLLVCVFLTACGAPNSPEATVSSSVVSLGLQVRNSGLPGGYVWLSIPGQANQGRWHQFGMAEFICVTCPDPFVHSGSGYAIAILDESCEIRATYQVDGGPLLVEIDPGPTLSIGQAPPLGDWLPGDSPPAEPASIPCTPP